MKQPVQLYGSGSIKSSQPFFALDLYPNNCPEKEKYYSAIKSGFYEIFFSRFQADFKDRSAVKKACLTQIFYGGEKNRGKIWYHFQSLFPVLADIIENSFAESRKTYPHKPGNSLLSYKLQRVESDCVMEAAKNLSFSNIPVVSIHDALLCRECDASKVKEALEESIVARMSLKPLLEIERGSAHAKD